MERELSGQSTVQTPELTWAKDKTIIELKNAPFLQTFMEFCNCCSYGPILICHGYYGGPGP